MIVGVVGRAHGVRGDVYVEVKTDEPGRRFTPGARLVLSSGNQVVIARTRWDRGRLVAAFEGYPDRTAVETIRGQRLIAVVAAEERPSKPDEYFDRQLAGLKVRDASGAEVGEIIEVEHFPAQDCLAIKAAGDRRLVPFVKALVPVVDLAGGFVQLADVGGLLEDLE